LVPIHVLSNDHSADSLQLFLSRAIDPPKVTAMEKAWSILEEIGAVDQAGKLTALGRHIVRTCLFSLILNLILNLIHLKSMLPVDLRLAKV